MSNEDIHDLAENLQYLKKEQLPLPVLYIGERASLSEQNRTWYEEIQLTVLADGNPTLNVDQISPAERIERFRQRWVHLPNIRRPSLMAKVTERLQVSTGYRALASILDAGYIRLVITGNLDPLIEKALAKRAIGPRGYHLLSHGSYNSIDSLKETLTNPRRPITILKLLGDFNAHDDTTIAPNDIQEYMEPLRPVILPFLASLLVVVGYGSFDDEIFRYFRSEGVVARGERIYYACSKLPESFTDAFPRRPFQPLTDEKTTFDEFFSALAHELGVNVQPMTGQLPPVVEPPPILVPDPSSPFAQVRDKPKENGKASPVELQKFTVFNVNIDRDQRLSFEISGELNYKSSENREWQVDIEKWLLKMQDLGDDIVMYSRNRNADTLNKWRRRAKEAGEILYTDLMNADSALTKKLDWVCNETKKPYLTFAFNGPLKDLSIPFELMYYEGHPLAVQYPLCRSVTGIATRHRQDFDTFVRFLKKNDRTLQVLLIASDTDNGLLAVDQEVDHIIEVLHRRAKSIRLKIHVDILRGENATLDTVKNKLKACAYHIVHYAGHGQYDQKDSENSGLFFRLNKSLQRGVGKLTSREIGLLMAGSETQLFFLSSCVGAYVGSTAQLYNGDYLGVMDGLVTAGVPYVLGYRWYVTDEGSLKFAKTFYEELFAAQYIPEHAALASRSRIYADNGNDETWASALLIAQHVYHY